MLTFEQRNELKSNSQTTMIMNTKGLILSAIIVAMGMTAAGVAIRNGIVTFKDRDRCVVVKGLAEREVKANKVSWPLTYKEIGNNPSEMYNIIEHKNKQVVDFLKAGGVKDNEISRLRARLEKYEPKTETLAADGEGATAKAEEPAAKPKAAAAKKQAAEKAEAEDATEAAEPAAKAEEE